jgi:hypothetical protein
MKHRFTDFKKSYFVEARRHKMISQGFWTTWNIALRTLPKSHFATSRRQKMSSQGHSTSWNIASSTVSKSHFWFPRRQKMSSHGLSTPSNSALSTTRKSHFWTIIREKMNSRSRINLILCGPESRKFVRKECWPFESWFSLQRHSRIFGSWNAEHEFAESGEH